MPAVFALLPPAPASAAPIPFAEPGTIEKLMREAELDPIAHGCVQCAFVYPNSDSAWRAISSAAPLVRAVQHAGEDEVRKAVLATLRPFVGADGSIAQTNRFWWVSASRP
jgi:hypothetical protein